MMGCIICVAFVSFFVFVFVFVFALRDKDKDDLKTKVTNVEVA